MQRARHLTAFECQAARTKKRSAQTLSRPGGPAIKGSAPERETQHRSSRCSTGTVPCDLPPHTLHRRAGGWARSTRVCRTGPLRQLLGCVWMLQEKLQSLNSVTVSLITRVEGVGPYLNVFLNRGETFWLVIRCVLHSRCSAITPCAVHLSAWALSPTHQKRVCALPRPLSAARLSVRATTITCGAIDRRTQSQCAQE